MKTQAKFFAWVFYEFENFMNQMNATVRPAMTMLTMDISLIRMFSDGPLVSLNGSPTVSPTMVAL